MNKSSVLLISALMFAMYTKMIWSTFNSEDARIHTTHDFRLNHSAFGLSGLEIAHLHDQVDEWINRTYDHYGLVNIS